MMENKKAADERQHVKPQEHGVASNNTDAIVTDSKPEVKSENAIQRLRVERHIPVADMVEVVRTLYPGHDKPIHSKVDNGDKYGIRLRADAEKLLLHHFAENAGNAAGATAGKSPSVYKLASARRFTARCNATYRTLGSPCRTLSKD